MGLWPWTRVQGRGWGSQAQGFPCNRHWGAQSCAWPQGSHHGIHRPPGHRRLHTACSGIPGEVTQHRGLPMACTGIPGWAWGSPCGHSVPRAVVGHGDLLMVCSRMPGAAARHGAGSQSDAWLDPGVGPSGSPMPRPCTCQQLVRRPCHGACRGCGCCRAGVWRGNWGRRGARCTRSARLNPSVHLAPAIPVFK